MPIKNRVYGRRSANHEAQWDTEKQTKSDNPMGLRIVLGLFLLVVVGIAVAILLPKNEREKEGESASLAKAREVAEAFLAESDPQKRLQWVRNGEEVEEQWERYPDEARSRVGRIQGILGHQVTDGKSMTGFLVKLGSGNERLLEVVGPPEAPKVDWDAYACHSTVDWREVLGGEVKKAEVRVFCEPCAEAPPPFEDQSKWTCFRMRHTDFPGIVLGFAEVGSLREGMMKQIVLGAPNCRQRFVLELTRHSDGGALYEITRCLAVGWVETADLEAKWDEIDQAHK